MTQRIIVQTSLDAEMSSSLPGNINTLLEREIIKVVAYELHAKGLIKIEDRGVIDGRRVMVAGLLCDFWPEGEEITP